MGKPGMVVLFGSGETAPTGRRVHEEVFQRLGAPIRVAVLETPAGFEPNSPSVAGRIGDFLRAHLQNYHPQVDVIPARRRGVEGGADDPSVLPPLLKANYIFMGPGSPTYAAHHLAGTRCWHTVLARHRRGACISLASAGAMAVGAYVLPVYEIYKAGEDPHWRSGLDILGPYGLGLVFATHWNNAEGGASLDTSRCFMGRARMGYLLSILPPDTTVVGIDEHTALIVHMDAASCSVLGEGNVTLVRAGREEVYPSGSILPLHKLGPLRWPGPQEGIPDEVWRTVQAAEAEEKEVLPEEVTSLIRERDAARHLGDWPTADALRVRLAALGYRVVDTPEGPRWQRTR